MINRQGAASIPIQITPATANFTSPKSKPFWPRAGDIPPETDSTLQRTNRFGDTRQQLGSAGDNDLDQAAHGQRDHEAIGDYAVARIDGAYGRQHTEQIECRPAQFQAAPARYSERPGSRYNPRAPKRSVHIAAVIPASAAHHSETSRCGRRS
jgi:hypothetical protein